MGMRTSSSQLLRVSWRSPAPSAPSTSAAGPAKLYVFVPVSNEPSRNLFLDSGFTSCGILKDWLHTNHGFADAYFMTLLNKKA